MASEKGLNPYAAEFFLRPQNPSIFCSNYTRLNPYASSFYCLSNFLTAPTCFPSTPTTYSLPVPLDFPYPGHFEPTHQTLPDQPELVEVQQEAHDLVAHEFTQKFVPPKIEPRIRGGRGGHRRYNKKQDEKPLRVGKKGPKKFVDCNWNVPKRMVKRFSNVMPVIKDGDCTTVMIRNIPNKYTRDMLMTFLDNHCANGNRKSDGGEESESAFDFLYLPIDFWTGMNKGYAFVNFTNPQAVWRFYLAAHSQKWDSFQSNKIREIAYARIQGKKDLVQHFETMGFPCESEDVLPVCFSPPRDGSEKLVESKVVGKLEGWFGIGQSHKPTHSASWKKVKEA
ncbi:hypothetical protein M0R45_008370 [Rubus argutus]|uniref:Mei2-like C-terminal RNA recognition motif domain-containing protein n=1 Tax=Rubus argutus TaxID=59490 RepID=A0AAW1Y3V3_RUBAR